MTNEELAQRVEEVKQAVDAWKASQDTGTRRTMRAVWAAICVVAVFATIAICYMVM